MLIKRSDPIPSSEITPESVYQSRRQFITTTGLVVGGILFNSSLLSGAMAAGTESGRNFPGSALQYQPADRKKPGYFADEKLTPNEDVVRYNNFYEFGTDKGDPARYGHSLKTSPWSVVVDGEVAKPGRYHLEDLLAKQTLEERVYRLRCVEAWSMVIPWVGFPLADLLRQFEPTSRARYVAFETLYDPDQLRGQHSRTSVIDWPYREGLRMDEAMHPLSLIAVGLYGKTLLPQNGAPLRLVVPWKYGFKSIKSIVRISLTEQRPETSWESIAPNEYGFYANVNPDVDHPRWSQKTEKRLPTSLFNSTRIATQLFNGYAEQVASLYKGMDLRRLF